MSLRFGFIKIPLVALCLSQIFPPSLMAIAPPRILDEQIYDRHAHKLSTNTTAGHIAGDTIGFLGSTVSNKGKIKSVLKDVTSSSTIRSIATGALTAGVTAGACAGLGFNVPTGTTPTVYSRIGESAVQAAAQTATGATIGREKLGDSLINALRSGAAGTLGGVLAFDIGNEYKTGTSLNWATHKLLHAGVGAMGGLSGDPVAGAVGATFGEILGEAYIRLPGTLPIALMQLEYKR